MPYIPLMFISVQFSRSVVSNSLRPPGLQHARLPYPSPSPRTCSNSCPLSQWCRCPPSPPAFTLSQHQVFSSESGFCIRWPKYWSFSFSISPSNEYSGLTSFRIDWLESPCCPRDCQESSPTQFKSINSECSAFCLVQLSHPYMSTGKTIALTRWSFVSCHVSAF